MLVATVSMDDVSAWITPSAKALSRSSTPRLHMFNFDWMKIPQVKKEEEAAVEEEAKKPTTVEETEFIKEQLEETKPKSGEEIIAEIEKNLSGVDGTTSTVEKEEKRKDADDNKSNPSAQHEVHFGTVSWFDRTKGYGFIAPASGEKEIFVHQSDLNCEGWRYLMTGEPVEYGVQDAPKGLKAFHVTGPAGGKLKVEQRREEGPKPKKE